MMSETASRALAELAELKLRFGPESARRKRELLRRLEAAHLTLAAELLRLHELLCFWRAYPDDRPLLRMVERLLRRFDERPDLRRHRAALRDSGLAGTGIRYEFYMQMAQWLARSWPGRLAVDWPAFRRQEKLDKVLSLLALYCETPGLDDSALTTREWVERLAGPDETDAEFLVHRIAALPLDTHFREYFYEHLALPLKVIPGPGGPSRTRARVKGQPVTFQTGPLNLSRPDLQEELKIPPLSIRPAAGSLGRSIVDLAREAMVTRSRDLDAFAFGDPRDVRLIDCGDGLQFAAIGLIPERRLMLEAVYGFLTLKNGVPVGYVLNSALFGSVEVAFNVFDTYRGAEAGYIYGRLLATLHHLFRADAFTIYPYQLGGDGNEEGLASGAWWFYQKLGFRARDPKVLALMERELARMKKEPRHRSRRATLEKLAAENVYYYMGQPRDDVIGLLPLGNLGLRITDDLSRRFGSQRHRAIKTCRTEAMQLLGLPNLKGWTPDERLALDRWSPLVLILPEVRRWTQGDKHDLVRVIRAKGGPRESDFTIAFDRHAKLRRAVLELMEPQEA
jgi:hypothetical protein